MTAGAAVVSRVYREHNARRSKYNRNPRIIPEPDMTVQPVTKGCFLPCVKGPWSIMALCIGLMVLGGYMCNLAFHAEYYALEYRVVGNVTTNYTNESLRKGLKSMTYIGPSFIGVGSFVIIICCVVLFDLREKKMKTLLQIKLESQQGMSMEYTNRLILDRAAEKQAEKQKTHTLARVTEALTKASRQTSVNSDDTEKLSDPPGTAPGSPEKDANGIKPIPEYCEQMNTISTISQPPTPAKIQMQSPSKLPPYTDDYVSKDKWFPLMRLTQMAHEKGRIVKSKRKRTSSKDTAVTIKDGNTDVEAQLSLAAPPDYSEIVRDENQNLSPGSGKLQYESFPHVYVNEITPSHSCHGIKDVTSRQSGDRETFL